MADISMSKTCRSCVWWNPERDGEWGDCDNVSMNDYSSAVINSEDRRAALSTRPDFGCTDHMEDTTEHDA